MIEGYTNSLLSDLIECLPDATFAIDLDGRVIAWNSAIEELTGIVKEDIIDQGNYAYAKPFYGERRPCLLELIEDENSKYNSNYDYIHRKNGNLYAEVFLPKFYNSKGIHLRITASPLLDAKGKQYGAMESIRDITESIGERNKIKESEQFFESVIESAADVIVTMDTNNNILYHNSSMEDVFGYSKGELIGENLAMLMHDNYKKGYTDENQFLNAKKQIPVAKIKATGLRKDGSKFPLEMSISSWKSAENMYHTAIITDITSREHHNKALRVSEAKYKAFFESDPDYAILIDPKGVIEDVNHSAMQISGLSRGELVGEFFCDLNIFPEEELVVHQNIFSKVLNHEKITPYEARINNTDGSVRWVLNSSTTIKSDEDNYVLVIGSDITKRKNAEIKLKSSLKEKEVLLREIHHRVKNNLQIISSLLSLQEAYVKEDPVAVGVLRESQNRVVSMSMIHEMLYQSKNLSSINFQGYITNLFSNLLYSYGYSSNFKTELDIEDVTLNIETSIPVGLIISELVSNSLKYAFPYGGEGKLTLTLKTDEGVCTLVCGDDGVGLPPGFDFRNIESTLGLSLVNSLVEQLNGTIELDETHGTQFTIKFQEQKYNKRI